MSRNRDVASALHRIADILELQGVAFKPRAYRRAADNLESLGEDVRTLVASDRLKEVPGVGEAIRAKVEEFLRDGRIDYLERLQTEVPSGVVEILGLPGIGPKTALRLWKELRLDTVAKLAAACRAGRVRTLRGFGAKTEAEILRAIQRASVGSHRFPFPAALEEARDLQAHLRASGVKGRLEFAGSFRRGRDTVGDLDLLVEATGTGAKRAADAFLAYERVAQVLERGSTRVRVVLQGGLPVDLRIVPSESFGAALQYFTGSKEHNIAVRARAVKRGLTVNEYAVTLRASGRVLGGRDEAGVYRSLGMQWVPPELRENRGEVEAAASKRLPRLVARPDLRGDLHAHTRASDGQASAADMVAAARAAGHDVVGLSDHTAGLGVTGGLTPARFRSQRKELDRLGDRTPGFRILQGAEVNIRKDGSLDLDRRARQALDYVIGSVHSAFTLDSEAQTRRILRAFEEGVDILGHPHGRLLGERDPIRFDLDAVAERAAERGVLLEINASPPRLDLWGDAIAACRTHGARFIINSDAHSTQGLGFLDHGVVQARRGGLRARDVANAGPWTTLHRHLAHSRRA